MKWDMEIDELEPVLEKIWDLHDKLSDAIHSISRAHFLSSVKSLTRKSEKKPHMNDDVDNKNRSGFVYVKDLPVVDPDSAIQEAKSLNAIRTALENLEDQLEFFHTVQMQQHAERDAAIARLEQSRMVLALRLAEHRHKKYTVIEEAIAFVGDVHDAGCFVTPENLYGGPVSPGDNLPVKERTNSHIVIKVLISSLSFIRKSLNLDSMGGIVGNAALVAISMVAFLNLHQATYGEHPQKREESIYRNRNLSITSQQEGFSSSGTLGHLDVMMARG
ncbi:plastid division protein PDV1 [Tripterygium wilfordii]|uniref:Plastid division protein PDV1 n=1 Tax=Tripterygium wilfordii TaxID=458696 RepID=A0A7J7CEU7_TRIWF|nr:plastid division protein PDV1-like [Tripterygium wilfordii]KAF5732407.1 plastid division protein PDV1 [Tripterygium wilfordii]